MNRHLVVLAIVAAAAGCGRTQKIEVDTSEAKDIPKEIAMAKLRDLLPTAETIICTAPKMTLSQTDIAEWGVGNDGIEIRTAKEKSLTLPFAEVTGTRLDRSGKFYVVRVFSTAQPAKDKEHFQLLWRTPEPPQRVLELIEACRQKQ